MSALSGCSDRCPCQIRMVRVYWNLREEVGTSTGDRISEKLALFLSQRSFLRKGFPTGTISKDLPPLFIGELTGPDAFASLRSPKPTTARQVNRMASDVFILGGKRTAMGQYVGALKDISAIDLGATAAKGALAATGIAADEIDHTVIGNALQTSGDAIYGARHVALKAGVPFDRPALTVNRLCGSGIQSIVSGAQMIQLNEAQTALVGGIESMSQAPHVVRGARSGFPLGGGKMEDSLMVALLDTYCNTPMAGTAENLARKFEITRDEQDQYALRSQQEAKRARDAGYFADEIVPVEVKSRKGSFGV